jgi:hypothetical protein
LDVPDPASTEDRQGAGPLDAPHDLRGCLASVVRCGGCMAILYIIMFIAVILAAVLSLLFFR